MPSYILAGRIQAAIFVIVSTLISLLLKPFVIFTGAALALITLRKGWQQGVIYSLIATSVLIVISTLLNQGAISGLIAGLTAWLPLFVITSILAITNSWSKTLQLVLLLTVAGVLIFHSQYPDTSAYWLGFMEKVKPLLEQFYQNADVNIDETINKTSQWLTGAFAAIYALFTIVSLMIGRSWQARLFNPGGFGEEFRELRLGKPVAISILAGMALALASNSNLVTDLIIVAVVIMMFQGLSLAHYAVKKRNLGIGWLVALYVLMFLLPPQIMVLLAAFGLVDNFVDFRRKITTDKKQNSDTD